MEQNVMKRAPHSPYSPNLTPSDLYLIVRIKQFMLRCEFADRDLFLQTVSDILEVLKNHLGRRLSQLERLRQYNATGGEYVEAKLFRQQNFLEPTQS
jgi:hypothetical protein